MKHFQDTQCQDTQCQDTKGFVKWIVTHLFLTGLFALPLVALLQMTCLSINCTPSLPYSVFICVRGLDLKKLRRGDFVRIEGHSTRYTKNLPLTKRVSGFPGEVIEVRKGAVFVAGLPIGTLRSHTKGGLPRGEQPKGAKSRSDQSRGGQSLKGQPLAPLKAHVIPDDHFFVSADHPHSFDSRYEEFGLVKASCVSAKCLGLWGRGGFTLQGFASW